jgi:fluoroquinolone transport system permease protein
VLLSFLAVLLALPASGFVPAPLLPAVAPVALLSALLAPNFALALAAFARNKVEGLALMKGLSVFMFGPLAAYFVGSGWQLLLGIFPTYWPAKAFWVADEGGDFWPYILAGLAYNLLLLILLLRRFRKRVF